MKPKKEYGRVLSNPDNFIASDGLLDSLGEEWLKSATPDDLVSWTCQLKFETFTLKGDLVSFSMKEKSKTLVIRCPTNKITNLLTDTHMISFSVESVPADITLQEEYGDRVIVDVQLEEQYNALVLVTLRRLLDN